MKKYYIAFILIFHLFHTAVAQDSASTFMDTGYKSIDLKLGFNIQLKVLPSVVYQYNIRNRLAVVSFTEFGFNPIINLLSDRTKTKYFSISEQIGLGITLGKKSINNSLFLVGGGRYFTEKWTINDPIYHDNSYAFSKFMPTMGALYNLRVGRNKWYFTSQIYIPLVPFAMLKSGETLYESTISFGVGFKIQNK